MQRRLYVSLLEKCARTGSFIITFLSFCVILCSFLFLSFSALINSSPPVFSLWLPQGLLQLNRHQYSFIFLSGNSLVGRRLLSSEVVLFHTFSIFFVKAIMIAQDVLFDLGLYSEIHEKAEEHLGCIVILELCFCSSVGLMLSLRFFFIIGLSIFAISSDFSLYHTQSSHSSQHFLENRIGRSFWVLLVVS